MTFEAIQGWSDSQIPGDYKVRDPEKAAEALLFSRSAGYLEVVWLEMANRLVVYTRRPVELCLLHDFGHYSCCFTIREFRGLDGRRI